MVNIVAIAAGAAGLIMAWLTYRYVVSHSPGNETMQELGDMIHDGAMTFLKREYAYLVPFLIIVAVLLGVAIGPATAVAYLGGGISSILAGLFGMQSATKANTRTSERIGYDEARVVSGRFVLRTRIAKGDDGVQGLALWRFVLPMGSFRIRSKGSDGGHNGLKSIAGRLASDEYARLRIGVGPRPVGENQADFLLSPFDANELATLRELVPTLIEAVDCWTRDGIEPAMNRYNRRGTQSE